MDRLSQAVQRITHDGRLDKLEVHRLVGNGLPEDRVGSWVWRKDRKRNILNDLVMQDVGSVAHSADLMKLGNAVPICVAADVALDVENLVGRLVIAQSKTEERLVSRVTSDDLVIHLKAASTGVLFDDVTRITHRHKL